MKSGATTLSSVVDGDAPVKGDNMSALDRILREGPLPKARPKRQRHQHHAGDDGFLATNRSGYSLCSGLAAVPKVGAGVHLTAVHKGAKCLSQEHGAHACHRPSAQAPRSVGTWTGYDRSKRKRQKWRQSVAASIDHSVPEAGAVGQVPSLECKHDVGVQLQASPLSEEAPNGVSVSEITGLFPVCWICRVAVQVGPCVVHGAAGT